MWSTETTWNILDICKASRQCIPTDLPESQQHTRMLPGWTPESLPIRYHEDGHLAITRVPYTTLVADNFRCLKLWTCFFLDDFTWSKTSPPFGLFWTENLYQPLRAVSSFNGMSNSFNYTNSKLHVSHSNVSFPQIAIAIGVLTSTKGGGRRTTLADWTWHQAGAIVGCQCSVLWLGWRVTTNFSGVDVVPLQGAIVGCHCSVLWLGGWPTGVDVVPLLGAIAVCHCNVLCAVVGGGEYTVLWLGGWCHCWVQGAIVVCYGWGEGDDQLRGSGRGAIAGCHCSVLWREKGRVTTNFGEWTFHCRVPMAPYTAMASRKSIQKSCLELLADVTLFSTLMTQKLVFAIWGLCWYNWIYFFLSNDSGSWCHHLSTWRFVLMTSPWRCLPQPRAIPTWGTFIWTGLVSTGVHWGVKIPHLEWVGEPINFVFLSTSFGKRLPKSLAAWRFDFGRRIAVEKEMRKSPAVMYQQAWSTRVEMSAVKRIWPSNFLTKGMRRVLLSRKHSFDCDTVVSFCVIPKRTSKGPVDLVNCWIHRIHLVRKLCTSMIRLSWNAETTRVQVDTAHDRRFSMNLETFSSLLLWPQPRSCAKCHEYVWWDPNKIPWAQRPINKFILAKDWR